jgi:F420-non-reducing hydrogenase small subunit
VHEPRIIAFLCDHCAYSAADAAGREQLAVPRVLLTVRVMCTGRVSVELVAEALREGADGVLVAGCHPGECHYERGNLAAQARVGLLSRVLEELGVEPERLRIAWIAATESARFAEIVREMADALGALGPLDYAARALAASARPRAAPLLPAPPKRRPRLAFYWNASCGGCEEAIVDLAEDLHALLDRADVVLWPVAFDVRRADVEAMPDGDIDVAFINGAVRTDEQVEWAELLRRKARAVVAFGACAHMGGIVGLGNPSSAAEIAATAGARAGESPRHPLHLPVVIPRVLPLAEVVEVDAVIPGCPPTTEVILPALAALLDGPRPPKGAVLSPGKALCEICDRRASLPAELHLSAEARLATAQPREGVCFLADGFACLGPATRQGCGSACMRVNAPCRGCFGPPDGVADQGAAFLDAFGALVGSDAAAAEKARAALVDPLGTAFRYSLAAAALPARREDP